MTHVSRLIAASLVAFAVSASAIASAQQPAAQTASQSAATSGQIAAGAWTKKSQRASGMWSVSRQDGTVTINLDEDFRTRNAPDLKIFLSPLDVGDVENANATDGALLISELKANKGAQSYTIPDGVDLSKYKSVLIHCEAYTKLWSAGALR